jgi:hypothetical protein
MCTTAARYEEQERGRSDKRALHRASLDRVVICTAWSSNTDASPKERSGYQQSPNEAAACSSSLIGDALNDDDSGRFAASQG